jgi:hypothetical protein
MFANIVRNIRVKTEATLWHLKNTLLVYSSPTCIYYLVNLDFAGLMKADIHRWFCLKLFSLLCLNLFMKGTSGPDTLMIRSICPSPFSTASHLFATNWALTPVWERCQCPACVRHLHVLDDDCAEEPGGEVPDPRVVMPDPQVAEAAQGLCCGHHEALHAVPVEGDAGQAPDVRLVILSTQDKLDC